ncbi:transglutaminase domain protein [Hydrogenobacter thermophilus TK-6]|uniref:Transglutaminase-like protein n=1 Tax=Hydrogenobacter thermophilus (strain DSM 6534 / IAM 12695 / TK-6) TaxID=608538 RepID=D3DHD8_HYDTT|nr:DUF3488 and transglutaminase-like domain-containing protein [Hydrogenobacter thermophilus]ADO45177.1 transglutaminase domain protein [Hydrogenobacter thermophilus TK-6]BAI69240.1 transglutaminase-like protein [Hydrogenobacter thermophilus TK-6]
MVSLRRITLLFVHLCALVGITSLYNVADGIFFAIFLFVYAVGIYADVKEFYPIRRWILNASAIIFSLYFLSFISLEDLLRPFANAVLLLLAIKSLEEKKPRDMYQILLLSLFAVSVSTVYNLSISFAFLLLLVIGLGVSSLVFINLQKNIGEKVVSYRVVKSYALVSGAFFLAVAFLTIPFFVLLPRTQTPLFDLFGRANSGLKTGIADSVSLGKVGEIQQDNTVAFRVYGLPKGLENLYWRVSVFDTYIGNQWISTRKYPIPNPPLKGNPIQYTVMLEPTFEKYLPALDYPVAVLNIEGFKGRVYMSSGGVLATSEEITKPIRYTAVSTNTPFYDDPQEYTKVPENVSRSIVELAKELSKGAKKQEDMLKRVEGFFSKGFKYSLKLEKYEGNPLDYFLFVSKRGNCEYYASATAILLRLMGIPARVVGGFKGGVWNDYGKYYVITNSMAHVWVEAYINGRWIRVDTTPPYVSPGVKEISSFSLLRDAVVSFWYSNVVGFSSEKQFSLFKKLHRDIKVGLRPANIKGYISKVLEPALYLLLLYLTVKLYISSRKTPENLYKKLLTTLKVKGKPLPEVLLSHMKGSEVYPYVEYIVYLYQRHKFSPYKVYRDEIMEGYRALSSIKKVLKSKGLSNFHHS